MFLAHCIPLSEQHRHWPTSGDQIVFAQLQACFGVNAVRRAQSTRAHAWIATNIEVKLNLAKPIITTDEQLGRTK
jgi:hypothetical protein